MSVRHDWYQCDKYVTITVLYKNAGEKTHSIKIEPEKVEIIVEDYNLILNLLHPIDEGKSVYKVLPSKIEVKLMKSLSERWDNLTKKEEVVTAVVKQKKPEDWEKLSKEIEKNEETERQGEEALQALFKKIYADSSEDTRKAMIKSFTESGGTVLSTNWDEVGAKKVDVRPPDGCEYKPT